MRLLRFLAIAATVSGLTVCSPASDLPYRADTEVPGREGEAKTGPRQIEVAPEFLEACENGVVKATVYTRGQLNSAQVFLPRHAIHIFRHGGKFYDYPMSMTIKPDCLSFEETETCRQSERLLGFSAGLQETNVISEPDLTIDYYMHEVQISITGLREFSYSDATLNQQAYKRKMHPEVVEFRRKKHGHNEAFANFASDVDVSEKATLQILCRYDSVMPDHRPCRWRLANPGKTLSSRRTLRDEVSNWRPWFQETAATLKAISDRGEFHNEC
ncbi:hypothetical protein [uncultured Algimonas sp.]|uniref:hypothetical protein n=1 Tax=uncultured Algimonas sp. TaxID=1547920 RepID=UPI002602E692|nr:hypothetical protein [uncultured Algimonas sp.]